MKSKFEREYLGSLIKAYIRWEADEQDLQCFLDTGEYMSFNIVFANDTCVILDAGEYKLHSLLLYIEWGINECPVYVDIDGEYTCIGRVRNSRFWALVERFKNR